MPFGLLQMVYLSIRVAQGVAAHAYVLIGGLRKVFAPLQPHPPPPPARSMHWSPDAEGINGIFLGKEIIDEAAKVIEDVMRAITPRVGLGLGPWSLSWPATHEPSVHGSMIGAMRV